MKMHVPAIRRLAAALRGRDWFGVGVEVFAVLLGVALGLEASQWVERREENTYRAHMLEALGETLDDYAVHGRDIEDQMRQRIAAFEAARARGEQVAPPVYREPGGERPPTRAWDAVVATGVARAVEPELMFRLARFFSRADSFGERYIRYNDMSESAVLPYAGDPAHFYGADGRIRPEVSAYVDRLRDLADSSQAMREEAAVLRSELSRIQ